MANKILGRISLISLLTLLTMLVLAEGVLANGNPFDFYGYTYDKEGNVLEGTNVTIEIWQFNPWGQFAVYSDISDANGFFNVSGISSQQGDYGYKPIITHYSNGDADYVGKSLPEFPLGEIQQAGQNVSFYLQDGATINLTITSNRSFDYIIKDTKLGYPVDEYFAFDNNNTVVYSAEINVPESRNYSIMVFPNESMPTTYDLNNLSDYNGHADIQINISEEFVWVSGYALTENGGSNFSQLEIVPYIIEPGDTISEWSTMPHNMSSWRGENYSDVIDPETGFYNITLLSKANGIDVMLFFIAYESDGDDEDYLMYQNITLSNGDGDRELNVTLYPAAGDDDYNISLDSMGGDYVVNALGFAFNLVNASNATIQNSAFVDIEIDYSDVGGMEFGWMTNVEQEDGGEFIVPILNNQSIKKIEVFSNEFAPKKTSIKASEIATADDNDYSAAYYPIKIQLTRFDPGGIDEDFNESDLFIDMIKSNEQCNVPDYNINCSFLPQDKKSMENFHPLNVVMGGAPISFVMGRVSNGMRIIYKNVDLLASGPPDVLFDGEAEGNATNGSLEEAWRFGSQGPEIYSEVLIGIPLDPSFDLDTLEAYLGRLYDENWNIVWEAGVNDSSEIPNEFADFDEQLFNKTDGMPCSTTDENLSEGFCYIDENEEMIWIEIPHFSGVSHQIEGQQVENVSPVIDYNTTNVSSVDIGGKIEVSTNWTEASLNVSNMTCQFYVSGTLNETKNSTGSWCNFSYTTSSANYPSTTFRVVATDKYGNSGQSNNMSVQINLSCGSQITTNITLNRNLTSCSGVGLNISTNGVTIDCDGHLIDSDGASHILTGDKNYGVGIEGYNSSTIKNCVITDFTTGIYAANGNSHNFTYNNLTNNYRVTPNMASGIGLLNIVDSYIIHNNASNNDYGIHLESSSRNIINDNIADSNSNLGGAGGGYGIWLDSNCDNNTIVNNYARKNTVAGIYVDTSDNNVIDNNDIINNTGSTGYGIYMTSSTDNNLTSNTIKYNDEAGVYLISSDNNYIYDNTIWYNDNGIDAGVYLTSSSDGNVIDDNDISYSNNNGVYIGSSNNNNLTNNIIKANQDTGIYINQGDNTLIQENIIKDNSAEGIPARCGMDIVCSDNVEILGNRISGNKPYGMHFEDGDCSSSETIANNTLNVNLISPEEGYTLNQSELTLNFSYNWANFLPHDSGFGGQSFTGNCTLYVDGSSRNVTKFADKGTNDLGKTNTVEDVNLTYGTQLWYVRCEDNNGNTAESERRTLTMIQAEVEPVEIPVTTTANVETPVNTTELGNNNISANISIVTGISTSGSIKVSQYANNPTPSTSGFASNELGLYMSFDLNMSGLKWAIIKMYYTDAQVSGLDESSLRIYYYNASSDTWSAYNPPDGGVNTTANYVWANTTHFSIFGTGGTTPSGGNGNGGGTPSYSSGDEIELTLTGTEVTLDEEEYVWFEYEGEEHRVTVDSVSAESAVITVSSEPVTETFTVGTVKYYNLDGDSYYDLLISLREISNDKAKLNIKKTREIVSGVTAEPEEEPVEEDLPTTPEEDGLLEEEKPPEKKERMEIEVEKEGKLSAKAITAIILITLLAVIIVVALAARKNKD